MKLLILDSRPNEYYSSPGVDQQILGHNLGIDADWPVEILSRWNEFERQLKETPEEFGALAIHTSDALGAIRTAPAHKEIARILIEYACGKPVLFFSGAGLSGDPLLLEQAMQGYSGSARACSVTELRRLVREFGETGTGDSSVFEVFPAEVAFQALSALLPIGLLWELHQSRKKASENIRNSDQAGMSEFEKRVQSYALEVISKEDGGEFTAPDKESPEYRILQQWFGKLGQGDARKIWDGVDHLLSQTSLVEWNVTLTTLRDEWLALAT